MSGVSSEDFDAFTLLKGLRSYLKSEKEVGEPKTNERNQIFIPLRIKISNTAPNDIQKPLIVFTGVSEKWMPAASKLVRFSGT